MKNDALNGVEAGKQALSPPLDACQRDGDSDFLAAHDDPDSSVDVVIFHSLAARSSSGLSRVHTGASGTRLSSHPSTPDEVVGVIPGQFLRLLPAIFLWQKQLHSGIQNVYVNS